ncbi:MAG: DUF2279 domain-containing protein [Ignavibacteriaceae bacterium]|jgi:hypothetical protein
MKTIFIFLLFASLLHPQENLQQDSSKINYYKLSFIGGVTLGGFIYGQAFQKNLWWKGEKSPFHFNWKEDWTYALGADKFGHFFFPMFAANIYADAFVWSGFEEEKSLLYGGITALTYQSFTEIKDGFSKQWGFSWGDFSANVFGATYPLLQCKYPQLKNFNMKISFFPSERFKNGSHKVIFDDYESTYHWLSISIANYLPDEVRKYYPAFLNVAIGHSVKGFDTNSRHHEIYLALDLNIDELPGNSSFLKFIKKYLNFYHLPMPAVKVYPDVVWYGLKF